MLYAKQQGKFIFAFPLLIVMLLVACSSTPTSITSPSTHKREILRALTIQKKLPVTTPIGSLFYTYEGHTAMVFGVAWSPDAKRIASASLDGTVQVWDAVTGKHVLIYHGYKGPVFTVRWSPDGKYLASSGYDHTVQVWNALTGKVLRVYHGHTDLVSAASWSPDGKYIASGGDDASVQVWSVATGKLLFLHHDNPGHVTAIEWAPDGSRLAVASDNGTVQVFEGYDRTSPCNVHTAYRRRLGGYVVA